MTKEIKHIIFEKINKYQFLLFVFIFVFILIKMDFHSTINKLRNEKNELNELIVHLNYLNKDYLNICDVNLSQKQDIAKLNSYFAYLCENELTENKKTLEDIQKFFQFVLTKEKKSKTLICPNENNITIKELLIFSNHLKSYNTFVNKINRIEKSLFEEIKDTTNLNNFKDFTNNEKQKIYGGEDIFVAITGKFGENLQKANEPETDFINEINQQANKLYYTFDDYTQITLSQLTSLSDNYNNYINKVLENKMIGKDNIPFTDISIDKNIFSLVFLFIINIILMLIIIETIKLKHEDAELIEYGNWHNVYILLSRNKNYNIYVKIILILWSVLFLLIPIIILLLTILFFNKSSYEIPLILLMIILYYIWTFTIYKSLK